MSERKFTKLRKVSVMSLMDLLKRIFDEGADFIDIEGEPTDGEEDMIKISVRPEYYVDNNEEGQESNQSDPEYLITEQDYEDDLPPISDEDINDLIN